MTSSQCRPGEAEEAPVAGAGEPRRRECGGGKRAHEAERKVAVSMRADAFESGA